MGDAQCECLCSLASLACADRVSMKNDPEPESDESSDDDLSEDLPEDSAEEGVQSPSRKRRSLSDGSRTPSKRKRLDDDVRKFVSGIVQASQ